MVIYMEILKFIVMIFAIAIPFLSIWLGYKAIREKKITIQGGAARVVVKGKSAVVLGYFVLFFGVGFVLYIFFN